MRCHFICTDFCKVAAHHSIVEAIEQQKQAKVHGDLGFDEQEHIEAEQCEHNDEVAGDAHAVTDLMDEKKPLVDQSESTGMGTRLKYRHGNQAKVQPWKPGYSTGMETRLKYRHGNQAEVQAWKPG